MNKKLLCAAGLMVFLAGLWLSGCSNREQYAGKYRSLGQTPEINLELKANGEGTWEMGDQRVSFRWEVKKDKIWIHAKGGGVLIGTPAGNMLAMDMTGDLHPGCPSASCINFKRLPEGG
jgi:hypothetical protein